MTFVLVVCFGGGCVGPGSTDSANPNTKSNTVLKSQQRQRDDDRLQLVERSELDPRLPVDGCHCARQSAFSVPPSYRASPNADAVRCGH